MGSPVSCASSSSCVQLPIGSSTLITHIGSCTIYHDAKLTNVLYIPNFCYNLISISKLTKDLNCFVSFYPRFCLFQDLSSGKIKGIGKEQGALYILHFSKNATSPSLNTVDTSIHTTATTKSSLLWHARLDHASLSKLNKMPYIPFTFSNIRPI